MNGSRKNENSWRRGAPPFFKVRLWDSILQTLHSIVMQKTYGISIYEKWQNACRISIYKSDKSFRTTLIFFLDKILIRDYNNYTEPFKVYTLFVEKYINNL